MIGMKGKTKQSKAIPTPGHINPHTLMNEVCSPSPCQKIILTKCYWKEPLRDNACRAASVASGNEPFSFARKKKFEMYSSYWYAPLKLFFVTKIQYFATTVEPLLKTATY